MDLSDRMKGYEKTFCYNLLRSLPVVIRVDGQHFHTYARRFKRPFDQNLINTMVDSAVHVAKHMQGFKVGYIQSDEATFIITDYNTINTQGWFNYRLDKIISTSAALMTSIFNKLIIERFPDVTSLATFDARAFNVPKNEVVNVLLWRALDWKRNSVQMYSGAFFSNKELHKKNARDMHEMLHSIGKNWATDLTDQLKNGTFLVKDGRDIKLLYNVQPTYKEILDILPSLLKGD